MKITSTDKGVDCHEKIELVFGMHLDVSSGAKYGN